MARLDRNKISQNKVFNPKPYLIMQTLLIAVIASMQIFMLLYLTGKL